jgi:hypothetical protein
MPFDADSFLADILDKVDADKKQAVEEALRDPIVTKALDTGYRRQDDYSRNMDELKKARQEAEKEVQQARGALSLEREQLVDWYSKANEQYQAATGKLKQYQEEYGDLESGVKPKAPENTMTREEYEEAMRLALDDHSRSAIKFADVLTDMKMEHRERFSERLDTDALFEHQAKTKLPLTAAYKDFVSERVMEAEKAKHEEALKQAREEGLREGRSQANLPVRPDASNPVFQALEKPMTSEDRVNAAVSAWRQGEHSSI